MPIRLADPDRHADAVAAIYRAAVLNSIATFEEVPPDAAQMRDRMRATLAHTPWLVALDADHAAVGYAYAGPHHARPGYRWSVNISVYVAESARGRGVGRALYDGLLPILARQRYVNVYAGVALPNPASVALHQRIGLRHLATYPRVGYKLGAWRDVAWFGLRLTDPGDPPPEPIPFPELS